MLRNSTFWSSSFIFSSKNLNLHGIMMELWNYDGIWTFYDGIWTFYDGIWTFYDGKLTNWPCWSEGKLGTGPFTWLGQGFQTNFSEIPFQKRENLSIYGQNYGRLRSNGDFWRSCNRKKKGFIDTPVFCNASRNTHPGCDCYDRAWSATLDFCTMGWKFKNI